MQRESLACCAARRLARLPRRRPANDWRIVELDRSRRTLGCTHAKQGQDTRSRPVLMNTRQATRTRATSGQSVFFADRTLPGDRRPYDTVDRLFDSRHVNDLRLIAAAAFCITVVVFFIASINAVSFCMGDWATQHFANKYKAIAYIADNGGKHFISVFGPTLAIFGVILSWAYQKGSNRLGIVDLFACEIDTLCRVITVIEMVKNLTDNPQASAVSSTFHVSGKLLSNTRRQFERLAEPRSQCRHPHYRLLYFHEDGPRLVSKGRRHMRR